MKYLFIILYTLGFIISCSKVQIISPTPKEEKISKKRKMINFETGPTKSDSKDGFVDKTSEYGLSGVKGVRLYAVDFDADSWTDLVVLPTYYSLPQFFRFDSKLKKFIKLSYSPFEINFKASYLVFADFNKDRTLDLIVGTLQQKTELTQHPVRIFKGQVKGGKVNYKEKLKVFPKKLFGPASILTLDYDLDGKLDLFLSNWYDFSLSKPVPQSDVLLKGEGLSFKKNYSIVLEDEHKFSKAQDIYPNARPTFGASSCDVDKNGYPDILTTSSSGYGNKLWLNLYHKKYGRIFKDYGKSSSYAADSRGNLTTLGGGNSFFASCADYNNDGIIDIFLGELVHSYESENRDRSSILTGKKFGEGPPEFLRSETYYDDGTQSWSQSDRRAIWLDINIDGLLDLLVENSGFPPKTRLVLYQQNKDHSYQDVAEKLGVNILNPSGIVSIDLNRDGQYDIITGQSSIRNAKIPSRIYVFENRLKRNKKKSIRFFLQGKKANLSGIGAMIMLKGTGGFVRQWVEYAQGPLPSQNEAGILFGLGQKNRISNVLVRWPILVKNKSGNQTPLLRKYDLSKLNIKDHVEITLCENGKYLLGRKRCW